MTRVISSKSGAWNGSVQSAGRLHVGHRDGLAAGVHPADVLVDDLAAGDGNGRGGRDELRHGPSLVLRSVSGRAPGQLTRAPTGGGLPGMRTVVLLLDGAQDEVSKGDETRDSVLRVALAQSSQVGLRGITIGGLADTLQHVQERAVRALRLQGGAPVRGDGLRGRGLHPARHPSRPQGAPGRAAAAHPLRAVARLGRLRRLRPARRVHLRLRRQRVRRRARGAGARQGRADSSATCSTPSRRSSAAA